MVARLLFLDDEANVLDGVSRALRGKFEVMTTTEPAQALEWLGPQGPEFAVVVSDMRMPGMDGATFLKRARELRPEASRLVLSGHSELDAAVRAINEGAVFRFIVKPAQRESLLATLDAAVEQHRLVMAERELLERTLTGSIDALTEVLAMTNPQAFGRSRRLKRVAAMLSDGLGLKHTRWQVELAAMVSQLELATVPVETVQRLASGEQVSESERSMLAKGRVQALKVLARIPRLEPVTALLERTWEPAGARVSSIEVGALWGAIELEARLFRGLDLERALADLPTTGPIERQVVEVARSLKGLLLETSSTRRVTLQSLQNGMVLVDDVRAKTGALLITRGHDVTDSLLARLRNFATTIGVQEPLVVAWHEGEP